MCQITGLYVKVICRPHSSQLNDPMVINQYTPNLLSLLEKFQRWHFNQDSPCKKGVNSVTCQNRVTKNLNFEYHQTSYRKTHGCRFQKLTIFCDKCRLQMIWRNKLVAPAASRNPNKLKWQSTELFTCSWNLTESQTWRQPCILLKAETVTYRLTIISGCLLKTPYRCLN